MVGVYCSRERVKGCVRQYRSLVGQPERLRLLSGDRFCYFVVSVPHSFVERIVLMLVLDLATRRQSSENKTPVGHKTRHQLAAAKNKTPIAQKQDTPECLRQTPGDTRPSPTAPRPQRDGGRSSRSCPCRSRTAPPCSGTASPVVYM